MFYLIKCKKSLRPQKSWMIVWFCYLFLAFQGFFSIMSFDNYIEDSLIVLFMFLILPLCNFILFLVLPLFLTKACSRKRKGSYCTKWWSERMQGKKFFFHSFLLIFLLSSSFSRHVQSEVKPDLEFFKRKIMFTQIKPYWSLITNIISNQCELWGALGSI